MGIGLRIGSSVSINVECSVTTEEIVGMVWGLRMAPGGGRSTGYAANHAV